jgi:hypothetical protein
MSNFTKGPWLIYDDGTAEDSSDIIMAHVGDIDDEARFDICVMSVDEGRPIAERKANARLIAAAPELLEALELAYEAAMEPSRNGKPDGFAQSTTAIKIRAAIQKAKGE